MPLALLMGAVDVGQSTGNCRWAVVARFCTKVTEHACRGPWLVHPITRTQSGTPPPHLKAGRCSATYRR